MKKKLTTTSLLVLFIFIFVNLTYIPGISSVPVPNPNTYTYYRPITTPLPIDPPRNWESVGVGLLESTYESLVDYSGNSSDSIVGELASSWSVSPDGLQYTFNLRNDVFYHDGIHFNAYVMKYSLDRAIILADSNGAVPNILPNDILGSGTYFAGDYNVSSAINYLNAGGVEVLSDYVLRITLTNTNAAFLRILATTFLSAISPKAVIDYRPVSYTTNVNDLDFGMVPLTNWFPSLTNWTMLGLRPDHDSAISGVVPGTDTGIGNQHIWLETHAVGTGPYRLRSITNSVGYKLEKFTGWWGNFHEDAADVIDVLQELDLSTRISSILAGTADQIHVPIENISNFLYSNGSSIYSFINTFSAPALTTYNFYFNLKDSIPGSVIQEDPSSTYVGTNVRRYSTGIENASKQNPFTSIDFRKGFAHAMDYQTFLDSVYNGSAKRLEGLIPEGLFGHVADLIANGKIPSYSPVTAQNLLVQSGWKGNITLFYNTGNIWRKTASNLLKSTIEGFNIGISINVTEITFFDYVTLLNSGELAITPAGWLADYADPNNYLVDSFKNYYAIRSNYTNVDAFSYIDAQRLETNDLVREAQIRTAEEIIADDYASIYLAQPKNYFVTRDWVLNFPASGSLNPLSVSPNYEYIGKPNDWPSITTITETTTQTDTYSTTETVINTITATETTVTGISTVINTVTETVVESTVTVTTTVSRNITTTSSFTTLVIIVTVGTLGLLINRRRK